MNPFLLLADANTPVSLASSFVDSFFGGDWILIGIGIFILLAIVLTLAKVRASGVVVVGIGFSYLLGLFYPAFQFIFWLGIVVGVFMLIMGLRRTTTQ